MHSKVPDFSPELFNALADREQLLFDYIFAQTQGVVQSGPFKGIKLLPKYSWLFHGHLVPQWIGEYESQLHHVIDEMAANRGMATFVNLGCGNGYYSVGWAALNPASSVIAIDLDEGAIALSKANAELNHVADRIRFYTDYDILLDALKADVGNLIFFVDIEGHEADVIERLAALGFTAGSDFVIECHDIGYTDKNITPRLLAALADTHVIERIDSHNSSVDRRDLRDFTDLDRFIMTTEWRPASMHWLICRARAK